METAAQIILPLLNIIDSLLVAAFYLSIFTTVRESREIEKKKQVDYSWSWPSAKVRLLYLPAVVRGLYI